MWNVIILKMPLSKLFVYIPYYNSQNLIFPITFMCTSKEKKIFALNNYTVLIFFDHI